MLTLLCDKLDKKRREWSPAAMFQAGLGGESNLALPQPCFKHDRRVYLSDILSESCQWWQRKRDNSIQKKKIIQKISLGGESRSPAGMFQACLGRGVESCCPAAMFRAWQADVLARYTTREVVSVENQGVIIEYKLADLIIKDSEARNRSIAATFQAWLWWRVETCSAAAMFRAWQADILVRYTTWELLVSTKEAW